MVGDGAGRVGVPPAVLRVSRSTRWSLWAWLSRAGRLSCVRMVQAGRPNRRAGCPPYPAHGFLIL